MVDIESIHRLFKARQIYLPLSWLECCINWCLTETLPVNYTTKDVQVKVFEQWLLVDLRVLAVPSLPANLCDKRKYLLEGNYSVQIMYVIDISKPKYWQLQKIRNHSTKNEDNEFKTSKRILLLKLSDGVQEVEAMEYEPIPTLCQNLPPGTKIGLTGPILIRRGKIMLKSSNVKIIGGEVDDLLIQNATENILAKFLNVPFSMSPRAIEEVILNIETSDTKEAGLWMDRNRKIYDNEYVNFGSKNPFASTSQCKGNINQDKDEIVEDCMKSIQLQKRCKTEGHKSELNSLVEFEKPLEQRSGIDLYKKKMWCIKELNEYLLSVSNGIFKIRGKFKSVVERVTVVDNKFYLVIKIEDDTAEMNVTFNSDIIANLLNCSIMKFKDFKDMNRRTPGVEAEVMKALKCLRDGLIKLDNVMELQVLETERHPVVIKIF